jgi:N-acetyl-anhydromuramyl-L-alanine amidase AmpD
VTLWPDIPYIGPPASFSSSTYAKRYIAIHNTSNDATAVAEATYARRRTDSISSHYYCDVTRVVQSLDTKFGAFHAGSATGNRHAVSYEITGVNSWTRQQWLNNVNWALLCRQIARDCRGFNILAQPLTIAQMRAGTPSGIVTHKQMGEAWGGTDHTDPGPNFPMDHLLAGVRAELSPTPERIMDMGMMMIARDVESGQHWLCDGMTRRKVSPDEVVQLKFLSGIGALSVWLGKTVDAPNSIWPGVSDLLGLPVEESGGDGPDAALIRAVVTDVLNDTALTVG